MEKVEKVDNKAQVLAAAMAVLDGRFVQIPLP